MWLPWLLVAAVAVYHNAETSQIRDADYEDTEDDGGDDVDFDYSDDSDGDMPTTVVTALNTGFHSRVRRFGDLSPKARTLSLEEIREVRGALKNLFGGRELNHLTNSYTTDRANTEPTDYNEMPTKDPTFTGLTKLDNVDPTKFYEDIIEELIDSAKRQGIVLKAPQKVSYRRGQLNDFHLKRSPNMITPFPTHTILTTTQGIPLKGHPNYSLDAIPSGGDRVKKDDAEYVEFDRGENNAGGNILRDDNEETNQGGDVGEEANESNAGGDAAGGNAGAGENDQAGGNDQAGENDQVGDSNAGGGGANENNSGDNSNTGGDEVGGGETNENNAVTTVAGGEDNDQNAGTNDGHVVGEQTVKDVGSSAESGDGASNTGVSSIDDTSPRNDDNQISLKTTINANINSTTGSTISRSKSRRRRTSTKPPTTITTIAEPEFDIPALVDIIANLTYDFEANITHLFNQTLQKYNIPTCKTPAPSTTERIIYDLVNATVVAKCFVCGMEEPGIPSNAYCADAFAGDFLPLVPVDPQARGYIARYRKYCRYLDVNGVYENATQPRSLYGRFTGGCSVRWTDLSGVYTQRACRNTRHAMTGQHFGSKRMAKLEMGLKDVDNGCIISPMASLVPLSRGVSLYARFHACVCTGSWCNVCPPKQSWIAFIVVLTLLTTVAT